MKRGEIYSNGWFKAADMLDQGLGDGVNLTIKSIDTVKMDDGKEQRVLAFKESDQKLGLNATNWDEIATMTGQDDDDNWIGHKINVYPHKLDRPFNGHTHGIRVRGVQGAAPKTNGASKPSGAGTDPVTTAARVAAFNAWKETFPPGSTREEMSALWLPAIAKHFPGRAQASLTAAEWETFKNAVTGYQGEPATVPPTDDEIPF